MSAFIRATYLAFRAHGLTAHQAHAAAYCAARVREFDIGRELPNWCALFRGRDSRHTADIRRAIAHVAPNR